MGVRKLCVLFYCFTSVTITSSSTVSRFKRSNVYDNAMCSTNDTLSTNNVPHVLNCVSLCKVKDTCYSVFFNQNLGLCYNCKAMYFNNFLPETSTHSFYYHVEIGKMSIGSSKTL